jgi:hypothetical protein
MLMGSFSLREKVRMREKVLVLLFGSLTLALPCRRGDSKWYFAGS